MAVALIGGTFTALAHSQVASSPVTSARGQTVAIRAVTLIAPPFVVKQGGTLTGFNIDLWNAIATQLNRKTSYQVMPGVAAVEDAMRSKRADLVVAPVFITLARDQTFDFYIPIMEIGLQVMVRDAGETAWNANPLWDLLHLLFSRTALFWFGVAVLLVLIPAHLVWLFERRYKNGIILNRNYFPGILEAIYWALSTLTTQAETMPRQWVARSIAIVWMFTGVVFVAFYTAQLTTALTVEQIRGGIEGPGDLPGRRVGTIVDTTAVDYLREHHAQVDEFPTPDQMFKALLDGRVDAVVSGGPLLLYYAEHAGKGRAKPVGPEFDRAPVAIMVQVGSPLRREIDGAYLALRENGTYRQLYDKWFGAP